MSGADAGFANQSRAEPFPPTPAHEPRPDPLPADQRPEPDLDAGATQGPHDAGRPDSHGVGHAHRAPGRQGDAPEPVDVDAAEGAERMGESLTSSGTGAVGEPGPVPAPSHLAAAGTSETSSPVDGVRIPAVTRPGKADGEVDPAG